MSEKPPHLYLVTDDLPPGKLSFEEGDLIEVPNFFVLTVGGKPIGSFSVLLSFDEIPPDFHGAALAAALDQKKILQLEEPTLLQKIAGWFRRA